jgi:ribosome-associated protein
MTGQDRLRIDDKLSIPRAELVYRAARAGGPGGQHVNTSATRVELVWNIATSAVLDEERRARLLAKLANRIDSRGAIRLVESRRRSQHQNREVVTNRFIALIAAALKPPRPRRKTRPPRSAVEARLRRKKQRSERKRSRGHIQDDDE